MNSVSAGGVVINDQLQVILTSNRGQSWSFPKGHVEAGEKLLKAAIREIYEETGVSDLIFVKQLDHYQRPRIGDMNEIKTIHLFLFTSDQKFLKPIDPDNPEARWVDFEEVTKMLTSPIDQQFFLEIKESLISISTKSL